jgi:adenosylcobinamide kinase / adenosylcobinamide-phosphate guanylyltransferase
MDTTVGKLILILGGARSGKSTLAQQMAYQIGGSNVLFVATAEAGDDEMRERILDHQRQRPLEWQTLEIPLDIADCLEKILLPDVVLVDCITLLVSNLLLSLPIDCTQAEAKRVVQDEMNKLLELIKHSDRTWILVSNEVGMGVVPASRLGRLYRDALGVANQQLAKRADEVRLMVAGLSWLLSRPDSVFSK